MQSSENMISRYQMLCLGFLAMLAPIIRLLPQQVVAKSGGFAWLSALIAIIPLTLLYLLVFRFLKYALPGEGFGELFLRALGKPLGKAAILLFTLWLMFYAGFALRTAADRYINSAYENTSPAIFIVIMLLLALIPLLGRFKNLGRTAESFFPLLILVLALVFAFAFGDVNLLVLPPPSAARLPKLLSGVPIVSIVLSLSVNIGFLEGRISQKRSRVKTAFVWLFLMLAVALLLCFEIVGCFGPELSAKLSYPFFTMVQNISILGILERLDPVVLAMWVIADFVLTSTLMFIIVNNLLLLFGFAPAAAEREKRLSMKNRRWLIWLTAAVILTLALIMAPDAESLIRLGHEIVPLFTLALNYGLLPLIILTGLIRKKV